MKTAYLFPGQGSQSLGMCQELFSTHEVVRDTFDEADDLYGEKLSSFCFFGPEESLKQTIVTQPALYVSSVAVLRVLQEKGAPTPSAVAGHSIGEYAALTAAGAFDFSTGFHLVMRRAQEMQRAAASHVGTMAAVIGLDGASVDACCKEISTADDVVEAANFNSPAQVVISGTQSGIDRVTELLKQRGARKVIPLVVSGAFHSSLMRSAAEAMTTVLASATIAAPKLSVVSNLTGDFVTTPDEVRHNLAAQIDHPVRWDESIRRLSVLGCTHFVEVGPGSVLTGLNKRILDIQTSVSASDNAGVELAIALGKE